MQSVIELIPLSKLTANPANPNRMSKSNFNKLVAHIERTGRYEPIVVRPQTRRIKGPASTRIGKAGYEIINGHHRCEALRKLGHQKAQCLVWDVDQAEADLLLATLNRLQGRDEIHKRSELIERLSRLVASPRGEEPDSKQLSKLLPESKKQIERLMELCRQKQPLSKPAELTGQLANAVIFFLTDEQKNILDKALAKAVKDLSAGLTSSQRRAEALLKVVKIYLIHCDI
jgi:ParB-like chromosome segregation protein Spo0J